MIRLTRPSIDESDIQAVADVLRSGYLVQGALGVTQSSMTLPLFEELSEDDQDFVVDSLLDVLEPE